MLRSQALDTSILEKMSVEQLVQEIGVYYQELIYQNEELLRSSASLEEARNSYRDLFDEAPNGYLVLDLDYRIRTVNKAFLALLHLDAGDLLGQNLTRWVHPDSQDVFYLSMRELLRLGSSEICELTLANGPYTVDVQFNNNLLQHGAERLIRCSVIDETARKQAELALRQSEALYRSLVESFPDVVYTFSERSGGLYYSPSVKGLLGFSAEELLSHPFLWNESIHPDDRLQVAALLENYQEGRPYDLEYRIRDAQGRWLWLRDRSIGRRAENGEMLIEGMATDITERKQAEEQVRFQARLLDKVAQSVIVTDLQGKIIYWNQYAETLYGWTAGEVLGKNIVDVTPSQLTREQAEQIMTNLSAGQPWAGEFIVRGKDSRDFPAFVVDTPFSDENGRPEGAIGISFDITDRKQAEQALRDSEQQLRALINSQTCYVVRTDLNGNYTYWNDKFKKDFGWLHNQSFAGIRALDTICAHHHLRTREVVEKCLANPGEVVKVELDKPRPDGGIRTSLWEFVCLLDVAGQPSEIQCMGIEVTEQKEAQEQIRQSNERFTELADNIQEVFWMFDNRLQRIIYISPAYEAIWDRTVESLYENSRQYIDAIHADDRGIMFAALERQARGEKTEMEYRIVRPDGSCRWIYDRSFPIFDQQGALLRTTGIATDQTERKQAEQETLRRQALLEKVIRLGKTVSALTDLPACLREVHRIIRQELGFDRVGLFLYDGAAGLLGGTLGTSRSGQVERNDWFSLPAAGLPEWQEALAAPQGIRWIDDYQAAYNPPLESEMYGVRQHVVLAAWAGDQPVAMIAVDNLITQRAILPVDLEALQLFAGYAGLAIANAQLHASLEQRVRERTEELRHSEATYRTLFENSNDGIFLLSPAGDELSANQRAVEMLGYSMEEYLALGRSVRNPVVTDPDQRQDGERRFDAILHGHREPLYERVLTRRDGGLLDVEINLSPVRDADGNIILVQSGVRDITERKKAEDTMRRANHELERSLRLKDEFLASMSHELRTPLTGILGMAEVLKAGVYGGLAERQVKAVCTIEESGQHLLNLINDILDLSKIEAGRVQLDLELVDIGQVCQSSLRLVKEIADKKRQRLSFRTSPAQISLLGDARRIKQILVNLLSNAVKFTPEGGELGLEVTGDAGRGVVTFCVWDKGIGIAAEDMDKLFKPFIQLDSSLARRYEGTGLGLSLVQRLAEMHGGSVALESEPGKGSRFIVSLPWLDSDSPPGAAPARLAGRPAPEPVLAVPDPAGAPGDAPSILLVEDNPVSASLLTDFLGSLGYH
ncbi:MAG: PAS domain S-box protein, partial [Chloroflexota bacterium]